MLYLFRYVLQFHKESESELQKRKEEARLSLNKVEEEKLEINLDDYFPVELNFPTRPDWDYSMSKQELEARENRYFSVKNYLFFIMLTYYFRRESNILYS